MITSTTCFTVIFSLPFVRLDKIKQYESKSGSLNEEQITLIASKVSIEKSLNDIESVRVQIQEIANEV